MNIQDTKSFSFWKKFSHKFIILFSFLILAFAVQSAGLSTITKQGPAITEAQDASAADSQFLDSQLQSAGSGISSLSSITVSPTVTPVGGGVSDQHKCEDDLRYCDTNVNKMIHQTGGYWNGSSCVYAFVPENACNQPAPQPQPAQPTPVQPVPQVSIPGNPSLNGSPFCEGTSSAITWTWSLPTNTTSYDLYLPGTSLTGLTPSNSVQTQHNVTPNQRYDASIIAKNSAGSNSATASVNSINCATPTYAVPTTTLPACTSLATSSFCGQPSYDTCTYNSDGTVAYCHASQNPNCTGTLVCNPSRPVYPRPVYPIINPIVIPSIGGSNNTSNTSVTNNTTTTTTTTTREVIREVPVVQSQPIAIQVAAVDCPVNTTKTVQDNKIVCLQQVKVVLAGVAETKELPKTGLPLLAWAAAAFIPMGAKIKRFNQGLSEKLAGDPNYLWEDRQFKI
ncbi:MAG: hypothetical protein Q7R49_05905 [Candidatus Daviesbacteria bacterium]|nr:hypothetical protein [Candidatus Daviesbacteria bacterium]